MFRNYFKTAFRNLRKNKIFSLINIAGLSIGISSALVIYLIVSFDFSFDKFEKDNDRIYRVVSNFIFSGEAYHNGGVTYPMGKSVKNEVTGVELVAPFYNYSEAEKVSIPSVGKDPVVFKKQEHAVFADQNYFELLPYQWVVGSPKTALEKPYQVVLTESKASLYFGNMNAADIIGKEVIFNDSIRTRVTGIVKDLNQNTDLNFKAFVSKTTLETRLMAPEDLNSWDNTNGASQLFIKLSKGTPPAKIEKLLAGLYKKYHKPDPNDHSTTSYALQPLNDIHFNSDYGAPDYGRIAHKPTLYGLLAVAGFLLLLGCINFINLTTAQASQRAKEIGIRKTMGSNREQLIFQFLSETFLLTLCATILSILIAPLLLKVFADFIPEGLHFSLRIGIIVFLIVLMIVVSLFSGFYPAMVLSAYKPVSVLKNQIAGGGKSRNAWLRKTLTVSQFVIAQVFIIGTILVSKQISYTLNADLGFKKDAILYFHTSFYDTSQTNKPLLVEKLKAIPEIANLCLANDPPTSNSSWTSTMKYMDGKKEVEADVQIKIGDTNYIHLFQMKLLAGSNLPASDTVKSVLINESFAKFLGFKNLNDAVGKSIHWDKKYVPIVGVLANFHQRSLHEMIKPLIVTTRANQTRCISVALQPQNPEGTVWKTAIAKMEKAWKEVYPDQDFDYHFLDDTIKKYYTAEQNISKLLMWATGLAIFISSLGLLGLITYITNQRKKEIGVRKVIGASVSQIIALLSKDFLKLVFIAFLIAAPIAWWSGHQWLQNFAYKTNISVWIFVLGGAIMFGMALFILSIKTFRAASANPVKSLRTE